MNIDGIQASLATNAVAPTTSVGAAGQVSSAMQAGDVVEISTVAQMCAKIHEMPDVRTDLVERVKAEIAAGTYDTPERIEIAISRLMDDLLG